MTSPTSIPATGYRFLFSRPDPTVLCVACRREPATVSYAHGLGHALGSDLL